MLKKIKFTLSKLECTLNMAKYNTHPKLLLIPHMKFKKTNIFYLPIT
jgi:hypothetical protein